MSHDRRLVRCAGQGKRREIIERKNVSKLKWNIKELDERHQMDGSPIF